MSCLYFLSICPIDFHAGNRGRNRVSAVLVVVPLYPSFFETAMKERLRGSGNCNRLQTVPHQIWHLHALAAATELIYVKKVSTQ